jgi:hypothetical protein
LLAKTCLSSEKGRQQAMLEKRRARYVDKVCKSHLLDLYNNREAIDWHWAKGNEMVSVLQPSFFFSSCATFTMQQQTQAVTPCS